VLKLQEELYKHIPGSRTEGFQISVLWTVPLCWLQTLLWPPSSAGHYFLQLWFLLSFFFLFSSPILSGHRLDVYHTSTHDVALRSWHMINRYRLILSANIVGRQKSIVCHRKIGWLLSANFRRPTKKISANMFWKPAVLLSGILLCDWSVCCLQRWKIEFYEINPMLQDSTDTNYRNRDLKRIIHTCCNETGVQDMKMLIS